MANQKEKPLAWLGSSKKDLMTLPVGVRKFFGHVLREKGDEKKGTEKGRKRGQIYFSVFLEKGMKKGTDLFHRLKPPPLVVVT
jgi:hypothetical protein